MTTPPQQQNDEQLSGKVVAALAAGGAVLGGLGPAAAGYAADAKAAQATAGLGAKAVAELTEQMVRRLLAFQRERMTAAAAAVRAQIERDYPERRAQMDELVAEEMRRERAFRDKQADRLRRDMPAALEIADPEKRRERVQAILDRELRYVELREEAMHDRAVARAEMLAVKEASPKGAYWMLSPHVLRHTPDCVALANKFWPWEVIEAVGPPPRHHGCPCYLLTLDEAVERGLMDRDQADVDVKDALRRARQLLRDAETLQEAVSQEEFEAWLAELAEGASLGGAMIALYPKPAARAALAAFEDADEPKDEIHLTLVFLTDDASKLDGQRERIRRAVARAAAKAQPLRGEVGGGAMFHGDPKSDERPLIATADVPGLSEFRAEVVRQLGSAMPKETHGFTPHLTLRYVPRKEGEGVAKLPPRVKLDFDDVYLVWGRQRERFPLGAGIEEAELEEAYVPRRYPKGFEHGGQFMPKLGGNAGARVAGKAKRALLSKLTPELPPTARELSRQRRGRVVGIAGRPVFVPEGRRFERTIGGSRYTSPPFSTHVYRDGEAYDAPRPTDAMRQGALEVFGARTPTARVDEVAGEHATAEGRRVQHALLAGDAGTSPAADGADGAAVNKALIDHGFQDIDVRGTSSGQEVVYAGPDGSSSLRVLYGHDGTVLESEWQPNAPKPAGRLMTRPHRTWDEFTGDAEALGRQIARDRGRGALIGRILAAPGPGPEDAFLDHGAERRWNGDVELGMEYAPSILSAAATRARGDQLQPSQMRDLWASHVGAVHEMLHAASPFGRRHSVHREHYAMEEALTEELAHGEASKWLRRTGQTDVLQWAADNPTDGKVLGTYGFYRGNLDAVLNRAGVAPEQRPEFIDSLHRLQPDDRYRKIADAIHKAEPRTSTGEAEGWARARMVETDDAEFNPTILPDAEPTRGARTPFTVAGHELRVGDTVGFTARRLVDDEWRPEAKMGTVRSLELRDGGRWTATVDLEGGGAEYGVLPQQIARVGIPGDDLKPDELRVLRAWGAGADTLDLPSGTIREGSLVRYGRADGGTSAARVVRILRDRNPNLPAADGWAVEAVTTGDSLKPNERVVLTPQRIRGDLIPAGTLETPAQGGGSPRRPVTLEDRANLAPYFKLPAGAFVIPTADLIPAGLDTPERTRDALAHLSDPAGGGAEKLDPLAAHPSRDGRWIVTGGQAALEAAKQRGLDRVPVIPSAVTEVDRHHRAARSDGEREGLKRARAILVAGGGAEDIAREARTRRTDDPEFQAGLRSAYVAAAESPRAKAAAGAGMRQGHGGWGMGFKGKPLFGDDELADARGRAPKSEKGKWDDSGAVRLTKPAGGSNGAMFGEDAEGRRWLVKSYRGDRDRVATELLANAVYRALGVEVPEAGTLEFGGKTALAYPLVDGTPGGNGLRVRRPNRELAKGFMADAFLANWDVVGLEHDNLLWPEGTTEVGPDAKPVRLDQGGTLQFRAMGSKKPFGPVPTEVWTMASPRGGQAFGTMALNDEVKRAGARTIAEKLDDGTIDALVDAAPFADGKMRDEVRAALKARRDWMKAYAAGEVDEPKPAEGDQARALLAGGQRDLQPYPEQEAALREVAGNLELLGEDKTSERFLPGVQRESLAGGPAFMQVGEPDFSQVPDKKLRPGPGPSKEQALAFYGKGNPKESAGVIVVEPDGRVWTFEPKGHFGGYERTLSKGRVDEGQTEQQAALRELWEETGLVGEITGDVGWYAGSTTITHYFVARRTGGAPWGHDGKETAAVYLQPPQIAAEKLAKRDRRALADAGVLDDKGEVAVTKELDSLLRHVKTRGDATLYASVDAATAPQGGWSALEGRTLEQESYLGLAVDRRPADAEAGAKGALVRLLVPEGSRALYLRGLPDVEFPKDGPDALMPRGTRLRVVRVTEEDGRTVLDAAVVK